VASSLQPVVQKRDHRILRVRSQHIELFRRQGRRFIRAVIDDQIGRRHHRHHPDQHRAAEFSRSCRPDHGDREGGEDETDRHWLQRLRKMSFRRGDAQRKAKQRQQRYRQNSETRFNRIAFDQCESVTAKNGEHHAKQIGGVGRTAPQVDAGDMIKQGESRRITPQRV